MRLPKPAPIVASAIACSLAALVCTGRGFAGGGSCCPADVDGDAVIGPADLATVLGAWGPCTAACSKTMVLGRVLLPTGAPAGQAVIVTSLGGQGVSGANGHFAFEASVDGEPGSASITAMATIDGVAYQVTKALGSVAVDGVTEVGELLLTPVATCSGTWQPSLGANGIFDGVVRCVAIFDDHSGSGPAIFAGGAFSSAGGVATTTLVKWTGAAWVQAGPAVVGTVSDLVVYDDGSGEALYASGVQSVGGLSTGGIARWNGSQWSKLVAGPDNTINDLQVFDDGTTAGPQLYAAGLFHTIGGVPAERVARWDGQAWHALGAGLPGSVTCLGVFDDGSGCGPELFAAGAISIPGSIAKWNGNAWLPLGTGVNASIRTLTTFDDGTGAALYAGGSFSTAGGQPAASIARWKNGAWSAVGSGVNGEVRTLAPLTDASTGERFLFAGGNFTQAGVIPTTRMARWNGESWSDIGANFNAAVTRIAPLDPGLGGGSMLFIIGDFSTSPSGDPSFARWGCVPTANHR
jgi:hypothetical protein